MASFTIRRCIAARAADVVGSSPNKLTRAPAYCQFVDSATAHDKTRTRFVFPIVSLFSYVVYTPSVVQIVLGSTTIPMQPRVEKCRRFIDPSRTHMHFKQKYYKHCFWGQRGSKISLNAYGQYVVPTYTLIRLNFSQSDDWYTYTAIIFYNFVRFRR